jgi:hypothetical protein
MSILTTWLTSIMSVYFQEKPSDSCFTLAFWTATKTHLPLGHLHDLPIQNSSTDTTTIVSKESSFCCSYNIQWFLDQYTKRLDCHHYKGKSTTYKQSENVILFAGLFLLSPTSVRPPRSSTNNGITQPRRRGGMSVHDCVLRSAELANIYLCAIFLPRIYIHVRKL